jgi:hypothetical protein
MTTDKNVCYSWLPEEPNALLNVDINNPIQYFCSFYLQHRVIENLDIYGPSKYSIGWKISYTMCTCTLLCVPDKFLFGLLQLQFTYILIILQYHTDIKLFHLWHVCSCSHSRYTDHLFTYTLWHLDFSKDFTEKRGGFHTLYILSFITPCWE